MLPTRDGLTASPKLALRYRGGPCALPHRAHCPGCWRRQCLKPELSRRYPLAFSSVMLVHDSTNLDTKNIICIWKKLKDLFKIKDKLNLKYCLFCTCLPLMSAVLCL